MEVSSVPVLCKRLIFSAIQRCLISDELSRLSVVLKPCPQFDPPLVRISVSDTGSGSNMDEFQSLRSSTNPILSSKWDGVISITTTSISENEIHHFSINLRETESSRRLSKLPSIMKYGAKFSGTEASLSTTDSIDDLLLHITLFLQKICILKIPKVAIELLIDNHSVPGSQGNCVLTVDSSPLPSSATNIERLKSGLEEYALKHGNRLRDICHLCFSTKGHLKVGTGWASRSGSLQSNVQMMEAVVVISEISEQAFPSCYRACGSMTEIQDYAPDLAKTIAGLILSSNDLKFKEECFSLLGLQFQNNEGNIIEGWIKDRLISVIGINDRKLKRNREPKALLFEDCFFQSDVFDAEYEEGDEVLSSLDL